MAKIQSSTAGVTGSVNITNLRVTTPVIDNVVLPTAGVEYPIILPANTVKYKILARGQSKLTIGYVSSGTFLTVWPGHSYDEDNIDRGSTTLFVVASKANETIEIVSWS